MKINSDEILITGAGGMVASYFDFGEKLRESDLDITNLESCEDVFKKINPKIVIHLAALTDMEKCESEPELAYKINVLGTKNIVSVAKKSGVMVVYFSTGAVFGSEDKDFYTEDDTPGPINVYGKTKLQGEGIVTAKLKDYLIVRTGWLFGGGRDKDKRFVGKITTKILNNKEVKAVSDRFGSPTYIKDLVDKIKELINDNYKGIFHIVNSGSASYLDITKKIVENFNYSGSVASVKSSDFKEIVPRPKSEVMKSLKIKALRTWQEALEDYLKSEW